MSVKLNGHNLKKFGLDLLYNYSVESPEVKENVVEIKGTSNYLDLTESLTNEVPYERRVITLPFLATPNNRHEWHQLISELMNQFHGKRVELILPNDSKFKWRGRCEIQADYEIPYSNIVITINADPFKESDENMDAWEWDTFNFEEDVANDFIDIQVAGVEIIEVALSTYKSSPIEIYASTDMKVTIKSKQYQIKAGKFSYPNIKLSKGVNSLKFEGNGIVKSIRFKGVSL